jgi:hypothetical protein
MKMPSTLLAAAAVASASLLAVPAGAAPLSGSLALRNSTATPVETVQWRGHRGGNWRGGNWIGPAVGFAAGAAIGSALAAPYYYGDSYAYSPGYDSYAYAPGYSGYAYAPRYRNYGSRFYGDDPMDRLRDPARGED